MKKTGATYIMSSPNRATLYIGVTSDLQGRIWEHKNKVHPKGFTARYNCVLLVYYQYHDSIEEAIHEEKRLKAGSRKQKEIMIDVLNPEWKDLYDTLYN